MGDETERGLGPRGARTGARSPAGSLLGTPPERGRTSRLERGSGRAPSVLDRPARWAAAALVLGAAAAPATVLVPKKVPDLARTSEAVVSARVVGVEGYWTDDGRTIDSRVTLEVTSCLRGPCPKSLVLRVLGGSVGGDLVDAEGEARFEPDEDVVVFVGRWPDGGRRVNGYAHGKSRVVPDEVGNPRLRGGAADRIPLERLRETLAGAGGGRPSGEEVEP